jgi:hypothetical protein
MKTIGYIKIFLSTHIKIILKRISEILVSAPHFSNWESYIYMTNLNEGRLKREIPGDLKKT